MTKKHNLLVYEPMTEKQESKSNQFTTVKTAYARIAVILLAINFCLTGYVVYNINKTTQAQLDSISSQPSTASAPAASPSLGTLKTREIDQ